MIYRIVLVGMMGVLAWMPAVAQNGAGAIMPVANQQEEDLLLIGREHLLHFRLNEATSTFQRILMQQPNSIAAYYHLTTIAFWKALLRQDQTHREAFWAYTQAFTNKLDDTPESKWRTYFFGEAYFQRAFVHFDQGNRTKAAWDGRKAFGRFSDSVKKYPAFYEAYKGMGLLEIMIGSLPGSYRSVLNLFGYGGNVQDGLKRLREAMTQSRYSREEASIYYALFDVVSNESKEQGWQHLQGLHEQYPENTMFAYIYAFALISNRKAQEAEAVLTPFSVAQSTPSTYVIPYVEYHLGDALFKQNRFDEAAVVFERFIETFEGKSLLAAAHYKRGLCLEMMGHQDAANLMYRAAIPIGEQTEKRFARLARERLAQPMTAVERQLLIGTNAFDGGLIPEALAELIPLYENETLSKEMRAEAAYRIGRANHVVGDHFDAIRYYQYGIDMPTATPTRWAPWGQYFIGDIYETMGEYGRARQAYEAVFEFKGDYDYKDALHQRVKTALERLITHQN